MNLTQIFSTAVWETSYIEFEERKEEFLAAVRKFKEDNPEGLNLYNVNGYHSPRNMTHVPELAPLYEFVAQLSMKAAFDLQFVDQHTYVTGAWVNFHDSRSSMQLEHAHHDTFSGIFYLKVPENSGNLVIQNTSINPLWQGSFLVKEKSKFTAERISLAPKEGTIMLWPSYLRHSIQTNNHDDEMIIIEFTTICMPKENVET